jgi:hypothetical protein
VSEIRNPLCEFLILSLASATHEPLTATTHTHTHTHIYKRETQRLEFGALIVVQEVRVWIVASGCLQNLIRALVCLLSPAQSFILLECPLDEWIG